MTANQLSIILSNLDEQNLVVKYKDKQLNIIGVEFGIGDNMGTVYINVEE